MYYHSFTVQSFVISGIQLQTKATRVEGRQVISQFQMTKCKIEMTGKQ